MYLNHLLLIVDGNRRYAKKAGVSLDEAYRAAVDRVYDVINIASVCENIPIVSFYLFARYNLQRQPEELQPIFGAASYAMDRVGALNGHVRYRLCGRLAGFPEDVAEKINRVEQQSNPKGNIVNLLIGYSGSEELMEAMARCRCADKLPTQENLLEYSSLGSCPIDVLVRTGGVVRLSDGPLIGITQTRMYALDKMFPELENDDLLRILDDFRTGRRV